MNTRLTPVESYVRRHADDPGLSRLRDLLTAPDDVFSRSNMAGHITASGLVVTPDGSEALLIGHKGLGKFLQPGGHVDEDDAELWRAAAREIAEETGVTGITLHPWHSEHGGEPIDIDTHAIPARPAKGEGEHWHHDALFVFVAERAALKAQEEEVSEASWFPVTDERVPERLRRVYGALIG